MNATTRWFAIAGLAGSLVLPGCAAIGPASEVARAPGFVSPADDAGPAGDDAVRRDAYGRPIRFREQRLDRHGVMRDVETGEVVPGREGD